MRSPFSFGSRGVAIDLGTANTVVYVAGVGIVSNEPSVVAIETNNGVRKVRAVGDDAKLMMGKTPENLKTIRPLRAGVIADLEVRLMAAPAASRVGQKSSSAFLQEPPTSSAALSAMPS
jgi:rod shape-determining protein MreB